MVRVECSQFKSHIERALARHTWSPEPRNGFGPKRAIGRVWSVENVSSVSFPTTSEASNLTLHLYSLHVLALQILAVDRWRSDTSVIASAHVKDMHIARLQTPSFKYMRRCLGLGIRAIQVE